MTEESLVTKDVTSHQGKQLEITDVNGKTTIVFRKAILKGKVSSSEVLNTILIAAKLQAEFYIKKLSQGNGLDTAEIKALRDLGEITKLEVQEVEELKTQTPILTEVLKSSLYDQLADKLSSK